MGAHLLLPYLECIVSDITRCDSSRASVRGLRSLRILVSVGFFTASTQATISDRRINHIRYGRLSITRRPNGLFDLQGRTSGGHGWQPVEGGSRQRPRSRAVWQDGRPRQLLTI